MAQLTKKDVEKLLNDPSDAVRAHTAEKIAAEFDSGQLTAMERGLAEEIFRVMARDAAVRVREALSRQLRACPFVPRDIALTLAMDVESVGVPMLEASGVLTDRDLVEIVRSQGVGKRLAISRRAAVSEEVSDVLVETGPESVVVSLVGNRGAALSERTLHKVIDTFGENEAIQAPIIHRATLPASIAERLVKLASDNLLADLVARHDLSPEVASALVLQTRERATLGLLDPKGGGPSAEDLVHQLHQNDRLTPSIILRAVCTGDIDFFVASLARRTGIAVTSAYQLVFDKGPLGLKAIYMRSGLPENLYPAFRVAVEVAEETGYDGGDFDRERHCRRIIERILTQYEDMCSDDIEFLLGRLAHLSLETGGAAHP